MVKVERTPVPPPSLAVEKAKKAGNYRGQDVIQQLLHDFNGKCYICEIDELQSVEVEHLYPHGGDKDKEFSWDNLFLSCAHCNSVKNQRKYHNAVLDCCRVDPELLLHQRVINGHVTVTCAGNSPSYEAKMTAELIEECFEKKNTSIRDMECAVRSKSLMITMDALLNALNRYKKKKTRRNLLFVCSMLRRKSKFAGFTRAYVMDHIDEYPELAQYATQ